MQKLNEHVETPKLTSKLVKRHLTSQISQDLIKSIS